jgi:hypothetical protein
MNVVNMDNTNCRLESYQRYKWIEKRATKFYVNPHLGVQRRFRQHQHDYLHQVLEQADPRILEKYTDLESFVANHRESVGAKPMLPLIE